MTRSGHERARELIALAGANDRDLSDGQQAWLRAHLQECAACRDYAEAAGGVVRALRSQPWPLIPPWCEPRRCECARGLLNCSNSRNGCGWCALSCLFVGLSSAITTPLFWRAFEWMGVWAGVSSSVWQAGFAFFWIVPALVVSAVLLARGTHLTDATEKSNGDEKAETAMQVKNETQTGLTAEIKIVPAWAWTLAMVGFASAQFFFDIVSGSHSDAPPAWCLALLGLAAGTILGCVLLFIGYVSRDARRRGMSPILWTLVADSYSQWLGYYPVLHPAATAAKSLPAMWERRPDRIQLLPSLQLQTEPELSAVPALGWRK